MLVDLISEGIESALGDLPEDICWIVHRTSATNGGWPIYELPRPTVGSHQAQYCQIPTADSAQIENAQPSAGIDKSLGQHFCHKVRIEKESSRLWMNSVTSAGFCLLMLAWMAILVTGWGRLLMLWQTVFMARSWDPRFNQDCCLQRCCSHSFAVWLRDTVHTYVIH